MEERGSYMDYIFGRRNIGLFYTCMYHCQIFLPFIVQNIGMSNLLTPATLYLCRNSFTTYRNKFMNITLDTQIKYILILQM